MVYDERLLEEVNTLLEDISIALEAERSTFFLYDSENRELISLVAQGLSNIVLKVPLGNGIAGRTASTLESIINNNVSNNPNILDQYISKSVTYKINSLISVPVLDGEGILLGVLQVFNKCHGNFTNRDKTILETFAHTFSLLVKNTLLYYYNDKSKNNFLSLLNVYGQISSQLNLESLIPIIMSRACEITHSDRSSLFLLDEKTGELWTKFAKGLDGKVVRTKTGIVSKIAQTGIPLIVNNPYSHPDFDAEIDYATGYKTESIMGVPLIDSHKKVIGVIQTINKKKGLFQKNDLELLQGFSNQIRIALENAKLYGETSKMKKYLDTLIEKLDSGILTFNNKYEIQTTNDALRKMFCIEDNAPLNNSILESYNPAFKNILDTSKRVIESGEKQYQYGLEINSSKVQKTIANLSVLPMEDDEGKVIGAINVLQDITKEKRIHFNLSRYIPKHLVNQVINNDNFTELNAKSRHCSVLFSDIRNFTTLTETLGAVQIVNLLNKYFDVMVHMVHEHHGILDKYIGDAIMAVFGLPYTNILDPVYAVKCALAMQELIEKNNQLGTWGIELKSGIGISTGKVVSGNIGSEQRFEYTVIGDPVNLAARLEGETKKYGVDILVCQNTYNAIADQFYCRELDTVTVKGKQKPVNIYSVYGEKEHKEPYNWIDLNNNYGQGLDYYRNRDYKNSKIRFEEVLKLNPEDGPAKLFLERIKYLSN